MLRLGRLTDQPVVLVLLLVVAALGLTLVVGSSRATDAAEAPGVSLGAPATRSTAKAPVSHGTRSVPARRETRTFSWVPAAGATAYEFVLMRRSEQILVRRVKRPRLELVSPWRYHGRQRELRRGRYRWLVLPVGPDGALGEKALVSATLVIA